MNLLCSFKIVFSKINEIINVLLLKKVTFFIQLNQFSVSASTVVSVSGSKVDSEVVVSGVVVFWVVSVGSDVIGPKSGTTTGTHTPPGAMQAFKFPKICEDTASD